MFGIVLIAVVLATGINFYLNDQAAKLASDEAMARNVYMGIGKIDGSRQTGLLVLEPYIALDVVVEVAYPAFVIISSPDFRITMDGLVFPPPVMSVVSRNACSVKIEGVFSAGVCIQYELKSVNYDTNDVRFLSAWDHNTLTVDFIAHAQVGMYDGEVTASASTLVYWTNT